MLRIFSLWKEGKKKNTEALKKIIEKEKVKTARKVLLLAAFIFLLIYLQVAAFPSEGGKKGLFFADQKTDEKISERVTAIENSINQISAQISDLQAIIDQPSEHLSLDMMESRLSSTETALDAINETILSDPEKALTSKLLYEKYTYVSEDIDILNSQIQHLGSRLDTVIMAPLWGAILAFLGYFVSTLYLWVKGKTGTPSN